MSLLMIFVPVSLEFKMYSFVLWPFKCHLWELFDRVDYRSKSRNEWEGVCVSKHNTCAVRKRIILVNQLLIKPTQKFMVALIYLYWFPPTLLTRMRLQLSVTIQLFTLYFVSETNLLSTSGHILLNIQFNLTDNGQGSSSVMVLDV